MTSARFFQGALFFPFVLLLTATIIEAWESSLLLALDWKAWRAFLFFWGFVYGLFPYTVFGIFMFRKIRTKNEKQIIRLMWWSPIWFVPFFGLAWILLGLVVLMTGNLEGLGVMVV